MVCLYSLESQLLEYLNYIAVTRAVPELQQVEVVRSDRLPRRSAQQAGNPVGTHVIYDS